MSDLCLDISHLCSPRKPGSLACAVVVTPQVLSHVLVWQQLKRMCWMARHCAPGAVLGELVASACSIWQLLKSCLGCLLGGGCAYLVFWGLGRQQWWLCWLHSHLQAFLNLHFGLHFCTHVHSR